MKKPILFIAMASLLASCGNNNATKADQFNYWNDCEALTALKTFVENGNKKDTATYIPASDRIAVFDMDGTVFGELFPTYLEYTMFVYRALEDPTYAPTAPKEVKDVAEEIRIGSPTHTYASDMAIRHGKAAAKAYGGMTLKEFSDYAVSFLSRNVPGFTGMTYAQAVYKPMINVVDYLHANDYQVYIVSGSDRYLCREIVRDTLKIPENRVIGMDVTMKATGQDKDGVDYTYKTDDKIVRGDELLIKNLKFNKVNAIVKEIGKQPVISFGNSSGDAAMHNYTIGNNPHPSKAFMLVADDGNRDNGGAKNDHLHEEWKNKGYQTISMKNHFKTIYGENVVKVPSNA